MLVAKSDNLTPSTDSHAFKLSQSKTEKGWGHLWPVGHNFNYHSRWLLDDATYHILIVWALKFKEVSYE